MCRENAGVWVFVIASAAKQSTLALLHDGLLRFARNDGSTTELSWLFEMMERTAPMPGHTPPEAGPVVGDSWPQKEAAEVFLQDAGGGWGTRIRT